MMEAVGEAQVFAEQTGLGTGPMEELIGEAFGPVAGGYSKRYVWSCPPKNLDSLPPRLLHTTYFGPCSTYAVCNNHLIPT